MKVLIATNNQGKVKEMKQILDDIELITLNDIKHTIEVTEDGKTFEENAKKKAKEIFEATNIPCIADDSGIEIEEYDGWPGVKTARFLGEEKASNNCARQRNEYILKKMENLPKEKRKVQWITVIVYYNGKEFKIAKGVIHGYIATNFRGTNGFGFDEIFELEDGRTLAELEKKEKNTISSRKKALEKIKSEIFV